MPVLIFHSGSIGMEETKYQQVINECPIKHIAFIMDGNGRWAKKKIMPREFGHKAGANVFRKIMKHCCERGIKASTYYVFSTENWKRPKKEVDAILELLDQYLEECIKELNDNNVRFVFLGNKNVFPDKLRTKMEHIERISRNNIFIVNLALNYGGRDELVYAYNKLLAKGKSNVTERDISSELYTKDSPELDLIIRTGGDIRISNFLLWQAAYAELYFTDILWPDFTAKDVDEAIDNFLSRKRRFGGVIDSQGAK